MGAALISYKLRWPSLYGDYPWVPAPKGFIPHRYGPGGKCPLTRLSDGRIIFDECVSKDGTVEVRIFDNKDHPQLASLPEHTPRTVKAVFRRENLLKYLRATDYAALKDLETAFDDWQTFCSGRILE